MTPLEERLADEVRKYKNLYDPSLKSYKDAQMSSKSWSAIAKAVDLPVAECVKRWRSLRDKFVRLRRRLASSSWDACSEKKVPRLYVVLSWLSQYVKHREASTTSYEVEYTMPESFGTLTTHVLNTAMGVPAANLVLVLYRQDPSTNAWTLITNGITNTDGRCPGLISEGQFTAGVYKLRFETGQYWASMGETSFYPYVEIVFTISDPEQKYHVPLLLSRFSYSTYKGS